MSANQQKIVLASSNQGKLREIQAIFQDLPYELAPQVEWNVSDADETGLTFIAVSYTHLRAHET